jgi:hypothetical protein
MKKVVLLIFVCIGLITFSQTQKINGIGFVSSEKAITEKNVDPIINVNANYVAINPFGFVKSLISPNVQYNANHQWFGETTKGIKQYAEEFKKKGIKLMLKPQIWVMHGSYTGHIKMKSEKDWKVFELSYKTFILNFAEVANEIDADIFCIGVELEQFTILRPGFWKELIVEVRKIYKGKLTYAANWDEYKRVIFWNKLDYIGIDAYFPLSDLKTPSVAELEKGWASHKTDIRKVQYYYKKPILFTEFGYRSVDYSAKKPWDSNYNKINKTNLLAQKNALQAIHNQFWNEEWFAGGFLWKWFADNSKSGGVKDDRFTPQNKPAEELLKRLYAKKKT